MKIQNDKKGVKNIKLLSIVVITTVIVGSIFAFDEKILEPANAQESTAQSSNTSPQVITEQWPPVGNALDMQHHTPQRITVVIGVNNTVEWINEGQQLAWLSADNASDPDFAKTAPVFVSVSHLPSEYTIKNSVTVGPNETQVFYTDALGNEKSFFTMPMSLASNVLIPGKSFEYTFTHAGVFGYHGRPWERGYITVLEGGKIQ